MTVKEGKITAYNISEKPELFLMEAEEMNSGFYFMLQVFEFTEK